MSDGVNCTSFTDGSRERRLKEIEGMVEGEIAKSSMRAAIIYTYTCKKDDTKWENSGFVYNHGQEACWKCGKPGKEEYKETLIIGMVKRGHKLVEEVLKREK